MHTFLEYEYRNLKPHFKLLCKNLNVRFKLLAQYLKYNRQQIPATRENDGDSFVLLPSFPRQLPSSSSLGSDYNYGVQLTPKTFIFKEKNKLLCNKIWKYQYFLLTLHAFSCVYT